MIPLSTDWLAITVRLLDDVQRTPAHHTWVVDEKGTNVWGRRSLLYNEYGEKVLTLLSKPKSESLFDPSLALVEIANEWLYHGLGVHAILRKLRWCVPYDIVNLSRLDLAVDFNPNARMCRQIVGLAKGGLEICKKRNGSGFWSVSNEDWMPEVWRGKRCPHDINWGDKNSDVKWKLYYKSKELKDAAGGIGWDKPYIVDLWRESKLDVNNVWRLEVSIKHCNKLIFNGLPLSYKIWREDTVALFEALYHSRFVLSRGGTRARGGHADHIPFLPVKESGSIKCRKYDGDRVCSARISLLRKLVQSVGEEEVRLDRPTLNDVLGTIDGIVRRDNLYHYFKGMVGVSYDEWLRQVLTWAGDSRMWLVRGNEIVQGGLSPNIEFDMHDQPIEVKGSQCGNIA